MSDYAVDKALGNLISYHVNHVMSMAEFRDYVTADMMYLLKNDNDWMKSVLDSTGISAEDQACLRKHYELEEVSDD